MNCSSQIHIIGGGLAGCEAAWQAAKRGIGVVLHEMRPKKNTPAHNTSNLAEIICSNSFGSKIINKASGLLMQELRMLNSMLLKCAEESLIPAGHALAVDRNRFSSLVQQKIERHPCIKIDRNEIVEIPSSPSIITTGPLTSDAFAAAISEFTGKNNLFFYDALAPIIEFDSINMDIAFWGSRYQKGVSSKGDYINCPFSKEQYDHFISELIAAKQFKTKDFESEINNGIDAGKGKFFEGCLPIEVMAKRGHQTLAYGPLRPVGLRNPKTGKRPYAVVQLRQDDYNSEFFNLVGFQTNLKRTEQKRVFRMIPGLEEANFNRYGQMHRNTFILSPEIIKPTLESKKQCGLFFAGQISGIEGYLGSIASGLLAGINVSRSVMGKELLVLPATTMLGALCRYITESKTKFFQPMKANFGLLPQLNQQIKNKPRRYEMYSERSINHLKIFLTRYEI